MIDQRLELIFVQRETVETRQSETRQDANESRLTDRSQTERIEIFEEFFHPNSVGQNVMTNSSHQIVQIDLFPLLLLGFVEDRLG